MILLEDLAKRPLSCLIGGYISLAKDLIGKCLSTLLMNLVSRIKYPFWDLLGIQPVSFCNRTYSSWHLMPIPVPLRLERPAKLVARSSPRRWVGRRSSWNLAKQVGL